jgi:mRNA-degrading endonuclease RelE of RelBE toxin-antitoxin system
MSFKTILTPLFERKLKKLSKRHSSIKSDLSVLITSLQKDPVRGRALGNNVVFKFEATKAPN